MTINTTRDIAAPIDAVWAALVDFKRYPDWNPFLRKVEGLPAVGERVVIDCHTPGWFPMTFKPVITRLEPRRELRWIGDFIAPSIGQGEHVFEVHETEAGQTRLHHWERFTGVLVPIMGGLLRNKVIAGFEQMDAALAAASSANA
jgi:hypothetical protein